MKRLWFIVVLFNLGANVAPQELSLNIISGVPDGTPGVEYPIYHEVPRRTAFTCRDRQAGFYADPDTRCQVWHWCDTFGIRHSFLCANMTVFNQKIRGCDWWYNVDCNLAVEQYSNNDELYKPVSFDEKRKRKKFHRAEAENPENQQQHGDDVSFQSNQDQLVTEDANIIPTTSAPQQRRFIQFNSPSLTRQSFTTPTTFPPSFATSTLQQPTPVFQGQPATAPPNSFRPLRPFFFTTPTPIVTSPPTANPNPLDQPQNHGVNNFARTSADFNPFPNPADLTTVDWLQPQQPPHIQSGSEVPPAIPVGSFVPNINSRNVATNTFSTPNVGFPTPNEQLFPDGEDQGRSTASTTTFSPPTSVQPFTPGFIRRRVRVRVQQPPFRLPGTVTVATDPTTVTPGSSPVDFAKDFGNENSLHLSPSPAQFDSTPAVVHGENNLLTFQDNREFLTNNNNHEFTQTTTFPPPTTEVTTTTFQPTRLPFFRPPTSTLTQPASESVPPLGSTTLHGVPTFRPTFPAFRTTTPAPALVHNFDDDDDDDDDDAFNDPFRNIPFGTRLSSSSGTLAAASSHIEVATEPPRTNTLQRITSRTFRPQRRSTTTFPTKSTSDLTTDTLPKDIIENERASAVSLGPPTTPTERRTFPAFPTTTLSPNGRFFFTTTTTPSPETQTTPVDESTVSSSDKIPDVTSNTTTEANLHDKGSEDSANILLPDAEIH